MQFLESSELKIISEVTGSPADFCLIQSQIKAGRARFVCIYGTYYVLRVDSDGLVVVCAQGKNIKKSSLVIIELAKKLNIKHIFFHTRRPALARLLKHCNFKFIETDPNGLSVFGMVVHEYKFKIKKFTSNK